MATEAGGIWEMDAAAASLAEELAVGVGESRDAAAAAASMSGEVVRVGRIDAAAAVSMVEEIVRVGEMQDGAAFEADELARFGEVADTAASMADHGASVGDQSGVLNEQVCVESTGGAGDVMMKVGTVWVRFGRGFPEYFTDPNVVEPEIFGPDGPPVKFVVYGYTNDEVEAATALVMLRRAHPVLGIHVPTRPRTKMPRQRPRFPSAAELAALGFTAGSPVPEATTGRRRRGAASDVRSDGGGRHGGKPGDGGGGGGWKRATIIRTPVAAAAVD